MLSDGGKKQEMTNSESLKISQRKYYLKNKEKMNAVSRLYYANNKEKQKELRKKHYAKNREKILENCRLRYQKKKELKKIEIELNEYKCPAPIKTYAVKAKVTSVEKGKPMDYLENPII